MARAKAPPETPMAIMITGGELGPLGGVEVAVGTVVTEVDEGTMDEGVEAGEAEVVGNAVSVRLVVPITLVTVPVDTDISVKTSESLSCSVRRGVTVFVGLLANGGGTVFPSVAVVRPIESSR